MADGQENDGWDEDGEDVADERSSKADVHFNPLEFSDGCATHSASYHHVLGQICWTREGEMLRVQSNQIRQLVDNLELHGAGLSVKGVYLFFYNIFLLRDWLI